MNYKSIKNRISGFGTIMCLMTGCFLLLSCGANDASAEDNGGNLTEQYLVLKQYGLNKLMITNDTKEATFSLTVKRVGGKVDAQLTAKLDVWSEEELNTYNNKEKTSYTLMPESFYSIIPKEVIFVSGANETNVEIKIDPAKYLSGQLEMKANYVIALKLNSDKVELRKGQCDFLLHVIADHASVAFTSTEVDRVNVKEAITSVKIMTTLDYMLDGKNSGSSWDFSCELKVPDNASELVTTYNQTNNSNYELLPADSYSLEKISYSIGDKEAGGTLSIKRDAIKVKYYLLPLTLANMSTGKVDYSDAIHYVAVGQTYTNPIISNRSTGDPTVIRAQDGRFYLYATQTGNDWMPIHSSADLVNWKYEKNAFSQATKPNWQDGNAYWAPEMRYFNGKYVLYFSWAKLNGSAVSHTAVATADSPLGPFPNSKPLLTNEEFGSNCIDQFFFEEDGKKYLFYGSFNGIYVVELTDDGLSVKRDGNGNPTLKKQVCGKDFEATNIYKKNGYYYLFASIGSCCAGINSSYSVVVGRSTNILGPYLDRKGRNMLNNSWELVLDGGDRSKWIGPGHNSIIIQDDEGTDWMIYHSYVRTGDAVGGRLGMLNRLQWTEEWPCIKGCVPAESDLIPVFHKR